MIRKECGCEFGTMCPPECLRRENQKLAKKRAKKIMKRGWPMYSDALACHPKQVDEFAKLAKERGVPTDFNPTDGRPKFESARHQQRYLRAFGYFNRDSNFSPKNA